MSDLANTLEKMPFTFMGSPLNNTRVIKPPKAIIYGPNGAGKSHTIGWANCPAIADLEGNISWLPHPELGPNQVFHKQRITHFDGIDNFIQALLREDHPFKTVVIDSLDAVFSLVMKKARAKYGSDPQYGADHKFCANEMTLLCKNLDDLMERKKMTIILLAHAKVKTLNNPLAEKYDRWETTLSEATFRVFLDWSSCIFLALPEYAVREGPPDKPGKKAASKINSEGIQRWFYTSGNAACFAKNTYNLPERIPMNTRNDWNAMLDMMRKSFERKTDEKTQTEERVEEDEQAQG